MPMIGKRLVKGLAIGAQKGFADAFNAMLEIIENLEGAGAIEIDRGDPKRWRIKLNYAPGTYGAPGSGSGEIPSGYSEQTRVTQIQWDTDYYKLQIKKGTVLVKDDSEDENWTDVINFGEFNA